MKLKKLISKRAAEKTTTKRRDATRRGRSARLPKIVGPEIPGNQFVILEAKRVGARSGARAGMSELFVEFDDGGVLMCSAKPLGGFYNPQTPRLRVRPIFKKIVFANGPADESQDNDDDTDDE